jgi:parallel beta-helix repeat protein
MSFPTLNCLFRRLALRKAPRRRPRHCVWQVAADVCESRLMLSALLWVDPASNHAGDFHTIQAAVKAASPGDTIKVAPGVYDESVAVPTSLSIIGGQVHIKGESGPSIVASDTTAFALSADGIMIKEFTIQPKTSAGNGTAVGIATDALHSGDTFRGNVFGNERDGLSLNSPTTGTVLQSSVAYNQFLHNQTAVVSPLGLSNARIAGNTFTGDVVDSIALSGPIQSNVQIIGNSMTADAPILVVNTSGSEIDGNAISNPHGDAIDLAGGVTGTEVSNNTLTTTIASTLHNGSDGIEMKSGISTAANGNDRIGGNAITGFDSGISVNSSSGNTIIGNTIQNSSGSGIELVGHGNSLINNTADNNGADGISAVITDSITVGANTADGNRSDGIYVVSSGPATLANNTASNNGATGILAVTGGATVTSNTADNNGVDGLEITAQLGRISYNTAEFNRGTAASGDAGLVISGASLTVGGNTTSNNVGDGLLLNTVTGSSILRNVANSNGGDGLLMKGCRTDDVANNNIGSNAHDGIDVAANSSGNDIHMNTVLNNTVDDLFDASTGTGTAGTANTWLNNVANTRNPAGLG